MKNSTLKIFIKKSTGLLCLVLLLLSANSNSVLLIDYQLRKAAYEKACENKVTPELKCHGKCQLTKNMTQSLEQDSPSQPRSVFEVNSKVHPKSPTASIFTLELISLNHIHFLSFNNVLQHKLEDIQKSTQPFIKICTPPPKYS